MGVILGRDTQIFPYWNWIIYISSKCIYLDGSNNSGMQEYWSEEKL